MGTALKGGSDGKMEGSLSLCRRSVKDVDGARVQRRRWEIASFATIEEV